MQLSLANVIRISVAEAQAGVGRFNTSNFSFFTREVPANSFGSDGFKIYLDPTDADTDFGTGSVTAKMVNAAFAQQPNMLTGEGYVVVVLFADTADVSAVQHISFDAVPASGNWTLQKFGGASTSSLAHDATASDIQTALRLLSGYSTVTVVGDYTSGFTVTFVGVAGAVPNLVLAANSLQTVVPANVTVTIATTTPGSVLSTESLADAIVRTKDLVQYFGIVSCELTNTSDMLAAAAIVQPLIKMAFFVSNDSASVAPGGSLDQLRTGGYDHSRGLYYGDSVAQNALNYMSAYAGRLLSVDFTGSNTTITMNLKDLKTIQPDPTINQTLLDQAKAAGADCYVSLQGIPKTLISGANTFSDRIYNRLAFIADLTVAQFNYLAETPTKIPQTEAGMDGMKSASRSVCKQYVTNQFLAPGTWNSPVTFGDQTDFILNVSQFGYYIYSQPISQQLQAAREAGAAPLQQIAIKEAGAIQTSDTIVYINA